MYFTYLNLPLIPTHLEEQILEIVNTSNYHLEKNRNELNISAGQEVLNAISSIEINYENSLGFPLSEAWNHFEELAHFDFLEVNQDLNDWARSNIDKNVAHVSIQAMYGGTAITPHIDEMRTRALNYVISTGGQSKTCFYEPKKQFKHLTIYPQTIFSFDRLDLIEEICIEPHRWHQIDVSTIHSVQNLDPAQKRISLSLSFL